MEKKMDNEMEAGLYGGYMSLSFMRSAFCFK